MGGPSWGYKGGLLGAVPLKRKPPGIFGALCCGLVGLSVWGYLRLCGCPLVLCGVVQIAGPCGGFGFIVGWMFFCVFDIPEIPFAVLLSGLQYDFFGLQQKNTV